MNSFSSVASCTTFKERLECMQRLWKRRPKRGRDADEGAFLRWLCNKAGSTPEDLVPRVLIVSSTSEPLTTQRCFGTVYGLDRNMVLFVPCKGPVRDECRLRPGLVALDTDSSNGAVRLLCFTLKNGKLQWLIRKAPGGTYDSLEVRNQGSPRTDGGREQEHLELCPDQWKLLVEQIAPLLHGTKDTRPSWAVKMEKSGLKIENALRDLNSLEGKARAREATHIKQSPPRTPRSAPRADRRKKA